MLEGESERERERVKFNWKGGGRAQKRRNEKRKKVLKSYSNLKKKGGEGKGMERKRSEITSISFFQWWTKWWPLALSNYFSVFLRWGHPTLTYCRNDEMREKEGKRERLDKMSIEHQLESFKLSSSLLFSLPVTFGYCHPFPLSLSLSLHLSLLAFRAKISSTFCRRNSCYSDVSLSLSPFIVCRQFSRHRFKLILPLSLSSFPNIP